MAGDALHLVEVSVFFHVSENQIGHFLGLVAPLKNIKSFQGDVGAGRTA